jgi:selenocysteine-specific elongation factor
MRLICHEYTWTRMKSIIVGTAGHIDHGKTALVKALTGIDADRLQEEKRRGITIDLGFAHLELPGPQGRPIRFGFVDVPGHERFVRNMLAGIGGIDLILLIIAADEGIKPQTREHFDICRLLSIQRGITLLTKCDLVDSETLDVVRLEVEEFLRGSFLEKSPIIPVSALKGTGLDELKKHLVNAAASAPARDAWAITRLPIDRVFTMKGFGTVVTGTLIAGTIRKDDELELFPGNRRVRARGVQVHGTAAERAVAGQRTAVNLAGIEKNEIERGMMLTFPVLEASSRLDVKLSLLSSAKPLKNGTRVHLHAFTSEVIATVNLFEVKLLQPGAEALAQLRLNAPLPLLPGDRFIIRQFSPVITVGGGVVLDPFPLPRLKPEIRYCVVKATNLGNPEEILSARIGRRWYSGMTLAQLVRETGWPPAVVRERLASALKTNVVVAAGDRYMYFPAVTALKQLVVSTLESFHDQHSLAPGIQQQTLRERLNVDAALLSFVLEELHRERRLEIKGDLVHLAGRGVAMKDDEAQSRTVIEKAFASAGLKVPALKDVLAGLKIDKGRAQKIVTLLLREKTLIKVSDDLVFHDSALKQLRQQLHAQKAESPKIDVARFKDLAGVTRKYAIPLLEYLDRERVTRRVGDERVIL